jgi:hypothetical protein
MDMEITSSMFPAQTQWPFNDDMNTSLNPGVSSGSLLLATRHYR